MPTFAPQKRLVEGTNAQEELGIVYCEYDANRLAPYYTSGEQISTLYATYGSTASATNAGAAGTKPTFEVNQFGNKPGIKFVRASNQYLTPPSTISAGAKTLAFVAKLSSLPASTEFYWVCNLYDGSSKITQVSFCNASGYTSLAFRMDGVSTAASVGPTLTLDTNPHVYVITYNGGTSTDAASYTLSIDGTVVAVAATGLLGGLTTSDIGRYSSATYQANMVLGSLVVLKGALGVSDTLALSRSMGKAFSITTV